MNASIAIKFNQEFSALMPKVSVRKCSLTFRTFNLIPKLCEIHTSVTAVNTGSNTHSLAFAKLS